MTPKEYIENVLKTENVNHKAITLQLMPPETQRLLHGAMGVVTEAGELMDSLKKQIFYGAEPDKVNIKEEIGDLFWYIGILCDTLGMTFEEVFETNVAKLKARYGEKFNETDALNRDLGKEREILEE
jgi:NTP pyrophosphatase (non-canonical NTP hydrolase)